MAQNKESDGTASSNSISPAELKEVLDQLKGEESPKTAEERETYFMSQVGLGEQLAMQGTVTFELHKTYRLILRKDLLSTSLPPWLSSALSESTRHL